MNQKKAEIEITQRMTAITEAIVNEDTGMSDTSDSKFYSSNKSNIVQLHYLL